MINRSLGNMRVFFLRRSWLVTNIYTMRDMRRATMLEIIADNWLRCLVVVLSVHPVEQWRVWWCLLVPMLNCGLLRLNLLLHGRLEPVLHLGKEWVVIWICLLASWCLLSTAHHHLVHYMRWRVHHLRCKLRHFHLLEFRLKVLDWKPHRLLPLSLLEVIWSHLLVLRFDFLQAFAECCYLLSKFFNFFSNGFIFYFLLLILRGDDWLLKFGRLYYLLLRFCYYYFGLVDQLGIFWMVRVIWLDKWSQRGCYHRVARWYLRLYLLLLLHLLLLLDLSECLSDLQIEHEKYANIIKIDHVLQLALVHKLSQVHVHLLKKLIVRALVLGYIYLNDYLSSLKLAIGSLHNWDSARERFLLEWHIWVFNNGISILECWHVTESRLVIFFRWTSNDPVGGCLLILWCSVSESDVSHLRFYDLPLETEEAGIEDILAGYMWRCFQLLLLCDYLSDRLRLRLHCILLLNRLILLLYGLYGLLVNGWLVNGWLVSNPLRWISLGITLLVRLRLVSQYNLEV